MTKQRAVSLQIPVIPEQLSALTELLQGGGNPWDKNGFFPFDLFTEVHFGRWIIAPAGTLQNGKHIPASIVYAANVDGAEKAHVERLATLAPDAIDKIGSHCVGYPAEGNRNLATRIKFLMSCKIGTPGFYVGAPERTVQQIKGEAELHTAIREFTIKNKGKWKTSREAYDAVREFVVNDPKWEWAHAKFKLPKVNWPMMILFGLIVLPLLPFIIIMVLVIHFGDEKHSKPLGINVNQVPLKHLEKMRIQEDIIYQNQISQVFEVKRGMRKVSLHFFLWATSWLARNVYVRGELMGTPTIHFARWLIIDNGTRYVFFSNFDQSFDMYLGDFVDNSGWGLNLVYGPSVGYPTTKWLVKGGAYKIGEFLGWGRTMQVQSQIWYCAYPWDGLQQIVDRTKLRTELFNSGKLNDYEIKKALSRI